MKKTYLPTNDPARVLFLNRFNAKLSLYAKKYNISNDEVTVVNKCAVFYAFWVNLIFILRDSVLKAAGFKNDIGFGVEEGATNPLQPELPTTAGAPDVPEVGPTGIFPFISSLVKRIKGHKDYVSSDGEDMGIEGEEEDEENKDSLKPVFIIVLVAGGFPELRWTRKGTDGVAIYVDRGTGNWEFLAIDTIPNYIDTHPLPAPGQSAVWKYRMIYRIDDANVGQWSDDVSVTVTGK